MRGRVLPISLLVVKHAKMASEETVCTTSVMIKETVGSPVAGIYAAPTTRLGLLATVAISIGMFVQFPLAIAQEKERSATVSSGERVRIWFGANYGRRCATAGAPIFNLISKPSLGEVSTELADYTVPTGQNCAGRTYTGLRIWYKAGSTIGTDTFKYTIEFPHEPSNPTPSKGPQPVSVTVVVQ